jgi:hypothetical protein
VVSGTPSNIRLEGTVVRWDDNSSNEQYFLVDVQDQVESGTPIVDSIVVPANTTSFDLASDARTCAGGAVSIAVAAVLPNNEIASSPLNTFDVPSACPTSGGATPPPQATPAQPTSPTLPATGHGAGSGERAVFKEDLAIAIAGGGVLFSLAAHAFRWRRDRGL